jgi:hypothetical protein
MAIFHFQVHGEYGWEALGAGLGDGEDPIAAALDELRDFYGGLLPGGEYRVIEARSANALWRTFELEDGPALFGKETPTDGPTGARSPSGSADRGRSFQATR